MKLLQLLTIIALCASALTGCAENRSKPSTENNFFSDYRIGGQYVLSETVFLNTDGDLLRAGSRGDIPSSEAQFAKDASQWPHIRGVLRPGTRIKVKGMEYTTSLDNGPWVTVYGLIDQGAFAGIKCDLGLISRRLYIPASHIQVPCVNTNILLPEERPVDK